MHSPSLPAGTIQSQALPEETIESLIRLGIILRAIEARARIAETREDGQ